jgi:hypothetical protein
MLKWRRDVLKTMDAEEIRYLTYVPVMGRVVLRQINRMKRDGVVMGRWNVGQFGQPQGARPIRARSVKGAKAAAKRWIRSELERALEFVG